jgi:hypothetical protein
MAEDTQQIRLNFSFNSENTTAEKLTLRKNAKEDASIQVAT